MSISGGEDHGFDASVLVITDNLPMFCKQLVSASSELCNGVHYGNKAEDGQNDEAC